MAQHVRMNWEGKFGQFPSAADHLEEPGPRYRPTAFGVEDVAALLRFSRRSWRGARISLPVSGCVLSTPFLARRTWMRPLSSSIIFQVNSHGSLARRPWR